MAKIIEDGVHICTEEELYVVPKNPRVREHIEKFMGLKLGFMMTWAPGGQMATYESWPLADLSRSWSQECIDWTDDITEFKEQYINMNKTFNPIKFRPDRWAELAQDCGFKYLLFTTKHHDGFCMFDTKTTNYKITDESCPFSTHKYANVAKHLYDEFRKRGMAISTYFSKPDWHSEFYWTKGYKGFTTTNADYDVTKDPETWEKFIKYSHDQITELMTEYGKIDALWLDGGCVQARVQNQDLRIGEIAEKIRATTQPDLIVIDRTVGGEYENILTPEGMVPPKPIMVPWESCIPMGNHFSFHYEDIFKTPYELVTLLIDVVSKGGNLALNIPPQPDGRIPTRAVENLREFGRWLKINGEGIYETTAIPELFGIRHLSFTQKKDCIYMFYDYYNSMVVLPANVPLKMKRKVKSVTLLRNSANVKFEQKGDDLIIYTEKQDLRDAKYSDCFKIAFYE